MINKKIITASLVGGLLLGAAPVFALETETTPRANANIKIDTGAATDLRIQKEKMEREKLMREKAAQMKNNPQKPEELQQKMQVRKPGAEKVLGENREMNIRRVGISLEKREEMKANIEAMKAKREEIKAKFKSEKNKRILDHVNMVIEKLGAAVERLLAIGDKVGARIEKIEENGGDVSKSNTLFADFEVKAATAKEDIAAANAEINAAVSAEVSAETGTKVRAALKKAEESVRNTHKALVLIIESLKNNVKKAEGSADASVKTEANVMIDVN